MVPLVVGGKYTRKDIRKIFNIPGTKGGAFDTGHSEHNGQYFVFSTIDSPGTTGHDYPNKLNGYELEWYATGKRSLSSNSVQKLINAGENRHIFTRKDKGEPFTYQGHGAVKELVDQEPAKVIWDISIHHDAYKDPLPEEIDVDTDCLVEGAKKQIIVNAYERNPVVRKLCVDYYGHKCIVCGFDFVEVYGDLGKNFIHIHHLVSLKDIGKEYEVDPINDLRPVCPNCHAMLHRRRSTLSIEELKGLVRGVRNHQPQT